MSVAFRSPKTTARATCGVRAFCVLASACALIVCTSIKMTPTWATIIGCSLVAILLASIWRLLAQQTRLWKAKLVDVGICGYALLTTQVVLTGVIASQQVPTVALVAIDVSMVFAAIGAVVAAVYCMTRLIVEPTTRVAAIFLAVSMAVAGGALVTVLPATSPSSVAPFIKTNYVIMLVALFIWLMSLATIAVQSRFPRKNSVAILIQIGALIYFLSISYGHLIVDLDVVRSGGLFAALPLMVAIFSASDDALDLARNGGLDEIKLWIGTPALMLLIPGIVWVYIANDAIPWLGPSLAAMSIMACAALTISMIVARRSDAKPVPRTPRNADLELLYQPIVRTSDGQIVGAEALLRDRELEPVPLFVEQLGRAPGYNSVTQFILNRAFRDGERFLTHARTQTTDPFFMINLSPAQMLNVELFDQIDDALEESGNNVEGFGFELTEEAIEASPDAIAERVAELRDKGFLVALDDFGSGHASLHSLADVDFDVIKIDKSLLATAASPRGEQILERAIELGTHCGARVLVEGVETSAQTSLTRRLQVDYSQGFAFGAPMEMQDLLELTAPS